MKKVLSGILLSSAIMSGTALADCRDKCVTRILGECVARVKVCDVGSPADWFEQASKETTKVLDGVTSAWHSVYGILPENVRLVLNSNPFTLIGGYFGGLQGAALGQAVDQLLARVQGRLVRTKSYIEGSPDWKKPIYEEGLAIATVKDQDIVGTGQATKQEFALHIDTLYGQFLTCVEAATDLNGGWDCVDQFEDAVNVFVREARRQ